MSYNSTTEISYYASTASTSTYVYSRYLCVSGVYPLHITFAYLVVLSGALALVSRLIPSLLPYHPWFGRAFMLCMYWCMASSLLIITAGLPIPIIVFFIFMLVSLTVGWLAIKIHGNDIDKAVLSKVEEVLKSMESSSPSLAQLNLRELMTQERTNYVNGKTMRERLFSMKALHGLLMTFAWYQMLGRTLVTSPANWHGCFTYPAYKSATGEAVFLPEMEPEYPWQGTEGNFIAAVSIPSFLLFVVVGVVFSWWGGRKVQQKGEVTAGRA